MYKFVKNNMEKNWPHSPSASEATITRYMYINLIIPISSSHSIGEYEPPSELTIQLYLVALDASCCCGTLLYLLPIYFLAYLYFFCLGGGSTSAHR